MPTSRVDSQKLTFSTGKTNDISNHISKERETTQSEESKISLCSAVRVVLLCTDGAQEAMVVEQVIEEVFEQTWGKA